MTLYFSQYRLPTALYIVSRTKAHSNELSRAGKRVLFLKNTEAEILPAGHSFCLSESERARASLLCENDVLQISDNGIAFRLFSGVSDSQTLFITPRCNSNCVMCPSSTASRCVGVPPSPNELIEQVGYLAMDTKHITITGGEPFLLGDALLRVFSELRNKLPACHYLLLTNGRALADKAFCEEVKRAIPESIQMGIPIHGATAAEHNRITMTPGSFEQTMQGLKNLSGSNVAIEIRIVVSKLNYTDIMNIARLIIAEIRHVHCVNFIGLEMLGNAAVNAEHIWIPYADAFSNCQKAIDLLVKSGIDVALYNFPLCAVPSGYRTLCARSITENKIVYAPVCAQCSQRLLCGGLFSGSYRYAENDVKAI